MGIIKTAASAAVMLVLMGLAVTGWGGLPLRQDADLARISGYADHCPARFLRATARSVQERGSRHDPFGSNGLIFEFLSE